MTINPTAPTLAAFSGATFATGGNPHHRLTRDIRMGAFPVVPEVFTNLIAAEDALDAVADDIDLVKNPIEPHYAFLTRTAQQAAAGTPITRDIVVQARRKITEQEERGLELMMIGQIRDSVQSAWTKALREHADVMLDGLRPELHRIVRSTKEAVAVLDDLNLTDAEATAAASDDQRSAMADLAQLRSDYKRLRGLQRRLVESLGDTPSAVRIAAPTWLRVFDSELTSYAEALAGVPAYDEAVSLWWKRIVDRDDLWIPTLTELVHVAKTAHLN